MKRRRIPLLSEETLRLSSDLYLFDEVHAGILTYISERYLGSFQIEESNIRSGYVCVSKDALCFFVRLLLNELFGRSLLRISYGQKNHDAFYLRFAYDKSVQIPEKNRYRLLSYAKFAKVGFEYEETETDAVITLAMPFQSSLFERVYAPKIANVFFYALSDIELDESEDKNSVKMQGPMWNVQKSK
jgi:hypothetical protein